MANKKNPFKTPPCVGRCSTVYGDSVCRGCKRFNHEVIYWNQYSNDQKENVWRRIESIISQVIPRWVKIEHLDRLQAYLTQQGFRYPKHLSPSAWALACLEYSPLSLAEMPAQCGLRMNAKALHLARGDKKQFLLNLQTDLYQISKAYYERQTQCSQSYTDTLC